MLKSWKFSFRQGRIIDLWFDLWNIVKIIQMSLNVMHHDAHVPTLACGPADSLIKLCRLLPLTHFKETFEALQMPGQRRGWSLRDQSSKPAPKSAKGLGQWQSCKRAGPGREARRTLTRSNLIICNSFSHVVLISGVADTGHAKSQKPTLSLRKESSGNGNAAPISALADPLHNFIFIYF